MNKESSTLDLESFIKDLASDSPTPGGGGAAALVGVVGIALGRMVANLTSGKKTYKSYQEEIENILAEAEQIQNNMESLISKDARAFTPLAQAYKLPKTTQQEASYKDRAMESALRKACSVPLETMEVIRDAIYLLDRLSIIGIKSAISDIGIGIAMCQAALKSSYLNVYVNTRLMKDQDYAKMLNEEADGILIQHEKMADTIYKRVKEYLQS